LRFTLLFERLAIDMLRQCNVTGATKILRISGDEAWGIMVCAVTRRLQRISLNTTPRCSSTASRPW